MEFKEGAILRLKLVNFLTYGEVEFLPKPGLNMIIGPNGAGKSSLVCAICLALAGNTNVLGRAQHASSFIKYDCPFAELEIELCRSRGNLVIWRRISPGKSEWKIDGRASKQDDVLKAVAELNIQVDNLCQFLPQDRVADFAKMTPQQLLVGTEQAVGSDDLINKHDSLKTMQDDLAKISKELKDLESRQDREVQLNQHLEADLNALREFSMLKTRLKLLESKLAWLNYAQLRDECMELKGLVRERSAQLEEERTAMEAEERQKGAIETQLRAFTDQHRELKTRLKRCRDRRQDLKRYIREKTQQMGTVQHSLKQKLEAEEDRKKKLLDQMRSYDELRANHEEMASHIESDHVEDKLEKVKQKLLGLNTELHELMVARETKKNEFHGYETDILDAESQMHQLRNQGDHRMEILKKAKPHAYEACLWLRENRSLFNGQVYGPIIAEMEVATETATSYLDSAIGVDSLFCFVAENADDMEKFVRNTRQRGWKVNAATAPRATKAFKPQVASGDFEQFGIQGFLSQLLKCPEAVYNFLCDNHQLHNIPYGSGVLEEAIYGLNEKYRTSVCVTGDTWVSLIKSKYSSEVTRSSRPVRKPRYLQVSRNSNQMETLEAKLNVLTKNRNFVQKEYANIKEQLGRIEQTKESVKIEEKKIQQKIVDFRGLRDALRVKRSQIERLEKEPVSIDSEKAIIRTKLAKLLEEYTALISDSAASTRDVVVILDETATIASELDSTSRRKAEVDSSLSVLASQFLLREAQVNDLSRIYKEARQKALDAREYAESYVKLTTIEGESSCASIPADVAEKFATLSNDIVEIQGLIADEKSRLTLFMPQNANAEEEYKARQKLIEDLRVRLEEARRKSTSLEDEISTVEGAWRSQLDVLVFRIDQKFSNFFKMLKCEGRVELFTGTTGKDYNHYGIKIMVRFRNEGELCELTPFHQSGGERSVSTIIYMMALQELSVVPFRVVDEINQGMDSVNERRIFEFIVKTAERNNAQYFLLTPKLLPGLPYSDRIYVHVIAPNSNVSYKDWNFDKFIAKRRALENA